MLTVQTYYNANQRDISLPDGATAADLISYYPFKGVYMIVNDHFVLEDFDQYPLHDGDFVRIMRTLVAGG